MVRLLSTSFAALVTLATSALAQGGAYYQAKPTAEVVKRTLVTRNTVWHCADGLCQAPRSPDRPAVMCELVARTIGTLASFSAGGAAFDEAALAKCNARAK